MSDQSPTSAKMPRPSPINGPAFLVFGLLFVVLGLSMDGALMLALVGVILVGLGGAGIMWQRRYEKAAGIEEVLPGKSPAHDSGDSDNE